ncbi:hypothetical protein M0802_003050 [Mischocyttarus mexicanus]|nr:hypothetical protein M0802_003050 [Mischocyttarus mexicanus]
MEAAVAIALVVVVVVATNEGRKLDALSFCIGALKSPETRGNIRGLCAGREPDEEKEEEEEEEKDDDDDDYVVGGSILCWVTPLFDLSYCFHLRASPIPPPRLPPPSPPPLSPSPPLTPSPLYLQHPPQLRSPWAKSLKAS